MTTLALSSFAIIAFAALIHASYQLSVSVLTLLSGHSLGRKTAHKKILRLIISFILGTLLLTTLLISTVTYYFTLYIGESQQAEQLVAAVVSGLAAGMGFATWIFYYRRGDGTALWLPRNFAKYTSSRAKATKSSVEAFGLGMFSVVAELIFIFAPLVVASLAISALPTQYWQIAGIATYVVLSILPLAAMFFIVGGGHRISKLQAWREKNKLFLQFVSGGSLIILAVFIFVDRVLGISFYGVF